MELKQTQPHTETDIQQEIKHNVHLPFALQRMAPRAREGKGLAERREAPLSWEKTNTTKSQEMEPKQADASTFKRKTWD